MLYNEFKKEIADGPFRTHVVRKRFAKPTEHNGLTALYFARGLEMILYLIHITASIFMTFSVTRKSTKGIPIFLVSCVVCSVIIFVKGVLGFYEAEWGYSSFYVSVALVNVYFILCIPQIYRLLNTNN
ncbi:hypothetical protein PVAND_017531 [Polypedilum vanderplanki]|uniref:Uncharacterized protein n=1 Tax=Polypedilum vanderplanki TaxID=319348 RepID=A0A9J6BJB4_POLVA|nr:hypothetical protein PVAND_017531 [Polypedilum vanderplanki]